MINKISKESICKFEKENDMILPEVYKEFLRKYNGYSIEGGLLLYSIDEIAETNNYLEIEKYAPSFIAVGDDGGDLVFLMKQNPEARDIYIVDQGDYDIEDCYAHIEDFKSWFKSGCQIDCDLEEDEFNNKDNVEVYLIKQPKEGLKDLVKIKNIFSLQISSGELLRNSKILPYKIVEGITRSKAEILIEKVGEPKIFVIKNI